MMESSCFQTMGDLIDGGRNRGRESLIGVTTPLSYPAERRACAPLHMPLRSR